MNWTWHRNYLTAKLLSLMISQGEQCRKLYLRTVEIKQKEQNNNHISHFNCFSSAHPVSFPHRSVMKHHLDEFSLARPQQRSLAEASRDLGTFLLGIRIPDHFHAEHRSIVRQVLFLPMALHLVESDE